MYDVGDDNNDSAFDYEHDYDDADHNQKDDDDHDDEDDGDYDDDDDGHDDDGHDDDDVKTNKLLTLNEEPLIPGVYNFGKHNASYTVTSLSIAL